MSEHESPWHGSAGEGGQWRHDGSGSTRQGLEVEEGCCYREKGWSRPCGLLRAWTAIRQQRRRVAVVAARLSGKDDVLLQGVVGMGGLHDSG
jgi:hypothetical protein